jgi:hypothetical protein
VPSLTLSFEALCWCLGALYVLVGFLVLWACRRHLGLVRFEAHTSLPLVAAAFFGWPLFPLGWLLLGLVCLLGAIVGLPVVTLSEICLGEDDPKDS